MPTHRVLSGFVHVSRVDLDLREDGEPVLRRVRRCDMLPGDVEIDLGGTVPLARAAKTAKFQLPEMDKPVTLPASAEGQRAEVRRLMEQYRPHVNSRDYEIGGGANR